MVVAPRLEQFTRAYPDVVLEVSTDDSRLDFVAGRYDAGIDLGEFIVRDMIAVKVSEEQRGAIVASPRYFESQPKPASPRDLTSHRCISISMGSAGSLEEYVAPAHRKRRARTSPRGLVSTVRRLPALLPQPTAAARSVGTLIDTRLEDQPT
jgi:DNA-binding transcriptional LysR family regulator